MVEAVVSVVADTLSSYLLQEPSILYGVREEVCWLERELRQVLCSIPAAVTKKANNELVTNWIRDVRDVAYDIEDVIESFMLEADNLTPIGSFKLTLTRCNPTACSERSMLMIDCCFPIFGAIISHYRAGRANIQNLENRITEISNRKEALGVNSLDETRENKSISKCESLQRSRSRSHLSHAPNIICLEKDKGKILELLRDGKNLCVIPIIGVSGQGKTTFVKSIYDSDEVTEMFDASYWISVSRDYEVPELLAKIIKQVGGNLLKRKLVVKVLKKKLRETLSAQGRYLIVMDDFCHKNVWDIIRTSFPDTGNGSRVIITTQHVEFARYMDPIMVHHELSFLNNTESMQLFLKKVYPTQNVEKLPDDLDPVGQDLIEKCQGLLISIVVLGSLLSTIERTHQEWLKVLNSLNREHTVNNSYSCIFPVCYEALPCHLKACFLYICSFSEDSEIPARRLMRLWIADGLILPKQRKTKTEIAEAFLEELASRSMVEVAVRRWDGSIKAIRIRKSVHQFCQVEARNCRFFHFLSSNAARNKPPKTKWVRRLALHMIEPECYIESYIDGSSKKWRTPKLRTLILGSSTDKLSLNGLKLLRVIDMEVASSDVEVPKEIATLIHLRYLRWDAFLDFQQVRTLCNLQTLHVNFGITNVDTEIGNFKDLQFLTTLKPGRWIKTGLVKLTNLEKLALDDIEDKDWKVLAGSLAKLHRLASLRLSACYDGTIPKQAISIFSGQHSLRRLKLFGRLSDNQLPDAIMFPPELTKLGLLFSQLRTDPMLTLKDLPNLTCLELYEDSYEGESMHCQAGGFPQLQCLKVHSLYRLQDIKLENGAMPGLTHLDISYCKKLKAPPEGLEHVTTLQDLILRQNKFKGRIIEEQSILNGAGMSERGKDVLVDISEEEELERMFKMVNSTSDLPSTSGAQ